MIISVYRLLNSLITANENNDDANHVNIPWQKVTTVFVLHSELIHTEYSLFMYHYLLRNN